MAIAARVKAMEREHRERAWLAHTTASLSRVKRMPKLESLLKTKADPGRKAPVQRKSGDELLALAKRWETAGRR